MMIMTIMMIIMRGKLFVSLWTKNDTGFGEATGGEEGREWDNWHNWHNRMPAALFIYDTSICGGVITKGCLWGKEL